MKIQVLGSGCSTCKKLFEITQKAVQDMNIEEQVEYLTGAQGMQKIIELGLLNSPVLVVDNKVAMVGFTPDISEVKNAITEVNK